MNEPAASLRYLPQFKCARGSVGLAEMASVRFQRGEASSEVGDLRSYHRCGGDVVDQPEV